MWLYFCSVKCAFEKFSLGDTIVYRDLDRYQAESLEVVRNSKISVIGQTPRVRRHREFPIRSVTGRSASRTTCTRSSSL